MDIATTVFMAYNTPSSPFLAQFPGFDFTEYQMSILARN